MPELIGFLFYEGIDDDDFTLWNVTLSKDDADKITAILEKYRNEGISVRGKPDEISITDVL